jgi:hypothetical protein
MIAVGDWVIYEWHGHDLQFAAGKVLYIDKSFVVVQTGGLAFDVASRIQFIGNREQVFAMKTKVEAVLQEWHTTKRAAEDKLHQMEGEHARTIRELLSRAKEVS